MIFNQLSRKWKALNLTHKNIYSREKEFKILILSQKRKKKTYI